ncbi:hypothetical protein QRE62_00320 (plasmid) [Bacillus mycoides]|uniref:Uncharacterized protein n=2 Tax=Bacillaceae TaxID=186817 RepID=A0ABX6Z0T0_BACMY|nr:MULTISPECIES: hypothetical protein [Bacillus]AJH16976.1 ABC transporter domain protein [Bacillus mycoides]KMQ13097.1 hypothetical protein TU70_27970 [Bacillus mycoides]MBG9685716.1 hypothetical protein [Bacillus mycoides]MCD4643061.1 hypothetical protein [Bacillus mycoides]MED0929856.1 hypothetical protein [Bacillus mycoides]
MFREDAAFNRSEPWQQVSPFHLPTCIQTSRNPALIKFPYVGVLVPLAFEFKSPIMISGIFNAGYDDFIVISDVDQEFYKNIKDKKCYSISYDVISFDDIVSVNKMLKVKDIDSKNISSEVAAL